MRILLTGRDGQVGFELRRTLMTLGKVTAVGRQDLNLEDAEAIRTLVRQVRPHLIINAAAYTAVDQAETDEARAMAVNGIAPGILAEEIGRLGGAIVHYSTDYVFDGEKGSPYTEHDKPNPLSAYGRSKLAGERAVVDSGAPHLILRTSWVYGARGKNFLNTMLRLAAERDILRVVNDQFGAPTWARMLAEATVQMLASGRRFRELGHVYHLTCLGQTTWHDFAEEIIRQAIAKPVRVEPITTPEYPLPARRPRLSTLDCAAVQRDFGLELPDWRQALSLCLQG